MTEQMPPLHILVQPRASYRARYNVEAGNGQNRLMRYTHGEENVHGLQCPTVEIPNEWVNQLQQPFYIRLTHVTVPNEQVLERCIHPYLIDTNEGAVIRDPLNNSLDFPVSQFELQTGRKSLRFCLIKLKRVELQNHGLLRRIDSDQIDEQTLPGPLAAQQMIQLYRLDQSQLRFSIAIASNDDPQVLVMYPRSSVYSHIMVGSSGIS